MVPSTRGSVKLGRCSLPLIDDVAEPEIDEPVRRDEEVEREASKALADIELDWPGRVVVLSICEATWSPEGCGTSLLRSRLRDELKASHL